MSPSPPKEEASPATTPRTTLFLGASTGVGLSALKYSLKAGRRCIAICRDPSKLANTFPQGTQPGLEIIKGNAHDVSIISRHIQTPGNRFLDEVVFTIGAKFNVLTLGLDDPNVCEKGMAALLEAIRSLRQHGVTGEPHIIVCSTTGMSRFGRDVPIPITPFYNFVLKVPHKDKRKMEDALIASGESFSIVRCSLLVNGETQRDIRVGIEDPKAGIKVKAIGYTISREDAGRWFAQNLVEKKVPEYIKTTLTITY